jgi:hypothetical protein
MNYMGNDGITGDFHEFTLVEINRSLIGSWRDNYPTAAELIDDVISLPVPKTR